MMKKVLLGLLLLATYCGFSQNLVWYFGASDTRTTSYGLDFTGGGAPIQRNFESVLDYYESVTVVSDNAGKVLYYSDGIEVFDGSHTKMVGSPNTLNGTADGPSGSSVQGAFSMLRPGSTTEYYLFTSQAIDGLPSGLRVNRIDMSLPGNGSVGTPLGEMVTSDSLLRGTGTEMMTAYGVCGSDTVWVISHAPNSWDFVRVLITSDGIQSVNTQTLATPRAFGAGFASGLGRGSMDINADGTQLIFTGQNPIGTHLLDFDKSTGLVSNHVELRAPNGFPYDGYGSEFSPDGTKAYFTSNLVSGMWQYDLGTGISTTMPNSAITHGEIITGVDDLLYVGKVSQNFSQTVGIIANPNAVGAAANYDKDAITFPSTAQSAISYAMPQGFFCPFDPTCEIDSVAQACTTDPAFQFTANVAGTWGGGAYINATGMFDPSVAGIGTHWITFDGGCPEPDSVQMVVVSCCPNIDPNLGANVTICDDATQTLDAGSGFTSYEWKENGVIMAGQTGSTINADSGTYIVNIVDGSGCTGTDTIEISNWQLPVVDLGPDTSYCAGGSITLDAGAFTSWVWTPNGETTQTINASSATTYGVTVTDANGCTNTDNVIISENTLPTPSISGSAIVCADSSTQITGTAGSGGTLAWSGITPFSSPLTVTSAGTYTLIETDGNGCIDSVDHVVTLEALPSVSLGGPYSFCDGQGSQLLDASTGASGESYVWSDASTNSTLTVSVASNPSVIVTSSNGCIAYDTAIVTTLALPTVDLGNDTSYCAGGSLSLDAGSFTSWAWTPNGETTQTITASAVTTYGVTVTDGNGCTATDDVIVSEWSLPTPSISGSAIVCADSSTLITGTAGSGGALAWSGIAPFSNPLSVSSAGTYTLIETDGNGCIDSVDHAVSLESLPAVSLGGPYSFCDGQGSQLLDASTGTSGESYVWSDASTNSTITVSVASSPSVIVTSANGCIAYDTATVTTLTLPTVDLGPDTFYCEASSIILDAGSFASWAWTPNGETTQTITVSAANTYGVTVTDANGCTNTDDVIISENALPSVDLGSDTTICEADSITLDATHADAATYAWTPNSETSATIKVGSTAGTYGVTITDVDGCVFTTDRTISEEALPVVNLGTDDIICDDQTKALDAGAGASGYAWYLDGSLLGSETSQTLDADSGVYVVSVTTALGCETRDTVFVDNYQLPLVNLGGPFEFCELDSIQLDAGNAGATFAWTPNGETTQTIWATADATYGVTVTDANNCVTTATALASEQLRPNVDIGANDSACVGLTIPLDATVPNGVTYLWSNGHNQATYTLVGPDTLSVIVTDNKGCVGYDTLEIAALDSLEIQFGDSTLECENDIQPIDAGSFTGAAYTWTLPNGSTDMNQSIVPNEEGWHIVTITDQYNCKGLDSIYVVIIPVPNIDLGPDTSFCSLGQYEHTIRMEFSQNIAGAIDWNDGGDNNNTNDTLFTATYAPSTVIGQFVDVATGCIHRDTVQLTEFCEPTEIILPNIFVPGGVDNPTFHPIGVTDGNYKEIVNNIVWSDFQVYNRWGLKVFQSKDLLPRWDGMYENRPVASGTYFWVFKYKDSSLKEYTYNGFVQVVQQRD